MSMLKKLAENFEDNLSWCAASCAAWACGAAIALAIPNSGIWVAVWIMIAAVGFAATVFNLRADAFHHRGLRVKSTAIAIGSAAIGTVPLWVGWVSWPSQLIVVYTLAPVGMWAIRTWADRRRKGRPSDAA